MAEINLADKTTLDSLNSSVGPITNPGSTTVQGKLNKAQTSLNTIDTELGQVNGKVTAVQTTINSGGIAGTVKSIQHLSFGIFANGSESTRYVDVAINEVDMTKSIILAIGAGGLAINSGSSGTDANTGGNNLLESAEFISSTAVRLTAALTVVTSGSSRSPSVSGSFQVVEYY